MCQQGGIAVAVAQWRNLNDDLGQAIVKVFTETPVADLGLQVWCVAQTMRTSTGILAATEPLDHPFLQKTQELGLQRHRQVTNFVEHQRCRGLRFDFARVVLAAR